MKSSGILILILAAIPALLLLAGCEESTGPSRSEMDLQIQPDGITALQGTFFDASAVLITDDGENLGDVTDQAIWYSIPAYLFYRDSYTGKLRAGSNGTGHLVAEHDGFVDSVSFLVGNLAEILFEPSMFFLPPGESQTLTCLCVVYITQGKTDTLDFTDQMTFEMEDESVAEISASGGVTAKAAGNTILHASYGGISESMIVNVAPVDQVDIAAPAGITLALPGNTLQLQAFARFGTVAVDVTASCQWTSLNQAANFPGEPPGRLAVLGYPGTDSLMVQATYGGVTSSTLIMPVKALDSLTITPGDTVVSSVFDAVQFQAMGHFNDGSQGEVTSQVEWLSSNPEIITISAGLTAAQGFGTSFISARADGVFSNTVVMGVPGTSGWFENFNVGLIHAWHENGSWTLEDGHYMTARTDLSYPYGDDWYTYCANAEFRDFTLEVDVSQSWSSSGGWCGLMFRRSLATGNCYQFNFDPHWGSYEVRFAHGWDEGWSQGLISGYSSAIDTTAGAWNHVSITMVGTEMTIVVNDSLLATTDHGALDSGTVGLGIQDNYAFEYRFDNLQVYSESIINPWPAAGGVARKE